MYVYIYERLRDTDPKCKLEAVLALVKLVPPTLLTLSSIYFYTYI